VNVVPERCQRPIEVLASRFEHFLAHIGNHYHSEAVGPIGNGLQLIVAGLSLALLVDQIGG
jgi:hypothetical protein